MKASYRALTSQERAAINADEVAAQNSAALKEMMSRYPKGFVQTGDDLMPTDAAEEGMPRFGRDAFHLIARLPDHNNSPHEIGISGCDL